MPRLRGSSEHLRKTVSSVISRDFNRTTIEKRPYAIDPGERIANE
jgi:hypothetical protein